MSATTVADAAQWACRAAEIGSQPVAKCYFAW
jgi:hypothetical protein